MVLSGKAQQYLTSSFLLSFRILYEIFYAYFRRLPRVSGVTFVNIHRVLCSYLLFAFSIYGWARIKLLFYDALVDKPFGLKNVSAVYVNMLKLYCI